MSNMDQEEFPSRKLWYNMILRCHDPKTKNYEDLMRDRIRRKGWDR